MISFLTAGTILGLSAGFAPGPLLALVISETLKHDMKAGIKVAIAPILTDLPIIILTIFILSKLSNFHTVLGIISFCGGFLLIYMGYEGIKTKGVDLSQTVSKPDSLKKGIIVNALSPHPYLFWISVGAPTIIKAADQSVFTVFAFVSSFYLFLVGAKISLAIFVGRWQTFLTSRVYIYIMRSLGLVLIIFALILFRDGMTLFSY